MTRMGRDVWLGDLVGRTIGREIEYPKANARAFMLDDDSVLVEVSGYDGREWELFSAPEWHGSAGELVRATEENERRRRWAQEWLDSARREWKAREPASPRAREVAWHRALLSAEKFAEWDSLHGGGMRMMDRTLREVWTRDGLERALFNEDPFRQR